MCSVENCKCNMIFHKNSNFQSKPDNECCTSHTSCEYYTKIYTQCTCFKCKHVYYMLSKFECDNCKQEKLIEEEKKQMEINTDRLIAEGKGRWFTPEEWDTYGIQKRNINCRCLSIHYIDNDGNLYHQNNIHQQGVHNFLLYGA